jgi:DNA-binding MarR family transcriptional regulator
LIDPLRRLLQNIVSKTAPDCPDYLPILGYDLLSLKPASKPSGSGRTESILRSDALSVLLSKSLLAFAVDFEHDSGLSLVVCANLLRLTSDEGIRIRDIPRLSGVSKEAIAMALRRAEECGLGMIRSGLPANRIKNLVLTSDGRRAREKYHKLTWNIETDWKTKLGRNSVAELRELLEQIIGDSSTADSLLSKGLRPYAEGWRASLPRAECLPHYPMVLHRGGFPDRS